MLIELQGETPNLIHSRYPQVLAIDFAVYKSWAQPKGEEGDGIEIITQTPWKQGYLYRVTLHRPTIYEMKTVSRGELKTWHSQYDVLLHEGNKKTPWVLEMRFKSARFTMPLENFDPKARLPTDEGDLTVWDHLGDEE